MIAPDQLPYIIALTHLYEGRPRLAREILAVYPDPKEAWDRISLAGKPASWERAMQETEFVRKHQIGTYYLHDADYPHLLAQCPDAPVLLYTKGNINFRDGHFISIVGTRQATERGKLFTRDLVFELAQQLPHLTIISGLAYGIDIAAHRAALEAGIPTLIIPGHGLDRIYPPTHRNEAVRALENGGIVTEYMSGSTPERHHFVARNRIIAGLSECTVVVESRARGGSLITAQMAFDYDRPVFAVPGRCSDDASAGCNCLIRDQRAALLQSPDDLIEAMIWATAERPVQTQLPGMDTNDSDLAPQELTLLNLLREADNGMLVNDLAEEADISYSEIITTLMMLEMKKRVKSFPGGKFMAV
ncbi:MAG: DNA-processing protein DprA [Paludibacteraceae bacterium]|nr:DNA-processing protein DprA [Paludibacteraceae bacterium]